MSHIGTQGVALIDRALTAVEVVNTTDETTVYSYVIPAGLLGTQGSLLTSLDLDHLNSSGVSRPVVLRVKLGATTMFDGTSANFASTADRYVIPLTLRLFNLGVTNSQRVFGWGLKAATAAPTTGVGNWLVAPSATTPTAFHGTAAIDSTAAMTLDVTVQHNAAASTISLRMLEAMTLFLP